MSTRILLYLVVEITDEEELRDFLQEKEISLDMALPELVAAALIVPFPSIRLGERTCELLQERPYGAMVHIRQKVEVLDQLETWRYCRERIQASYPGRTDDFSLAQVVLEGLVYCNPNPIPEDMGVDFYLHRCHAMAF
jgi:hypothetical protein